MFRMAKHTNTIATVEPTECQCTCPGLCKTLGFNGKDRNMNAHRYDLCKNKNAFGLFYGEREKFYNQKLEAAKRLAEVKAATPESKPAKPRKPKKSKKPQPPKVGVGSTFKKLLADFLAIPMVPHLGVKQIEGCSCNAVELDMNRGGPDWCLDNIENLVDKIAKNTTANAFTTPIVKAQARRLIKQAAAQHTIKIEPPKPETPVAIKWSYGITTVPQRIDDLFPRTVESLAKAGFDKPQLFVDNCKHPEHYEKFSLHMTTRYPRVKTAAHWSLTLLELYMRDPSADRYAIFQDDFVTYENLRGYLEKLPYEEKTYWNLYTFPSNQKLNTSDTIGWYDSNQKGKGAVAIVFDRATAIALSSSQEFVERHQDPHRGHKAIDGGIVTCLRKLGWRELVHNPSLVYHTGEHGSSMGNRKQEQTLSFKGENFNALDLLKS